EVHDDLGAGGEGDVVTVLAGADFGQVGFLGGDGVEGGERVDADGLPLGSFRGPLLRFEDVDHDADALLGLVHDALSFLPLSLFRHAEEASWSKFPLETPEAGGVPTDPAGPSRLLQDFHTG